MKNIRTATPSLASAASVIPWPRQWEAIDELDFSQIKRKLMWAAPEGKGWSAEVADFAILWYRRFLKLRAKYPERKIVPSVMIDDVWHSHILDTPRYGPDCLRTLGYFLHHHQYFGMNGDARERDEAFEATDRLFLAEFGESCRGEDAASICGAGCKSNDAPARRASGCAQCG